MMMDNTDWRSFERQLRAFIKKRVPAHAVDDVYGDVILRLAANKNKVRAADKPLAWMYKVTANIIADYYRSHAREQAVFSQDLPVDVAGPEEMDKDTTAAAELAACIVPLVNSLPGPYREALLMTEINCMKQVEAARRLGLSESGLKSRVQRGRARLKEAILACCLVTRNRHGSILDYDKKKSCC